MKKLRYLPQIILIVFLLLNASIAFSADSVKLDIHLEYSPSETPIKQSQEPPMLELEYENRKKTSFSGTLEKQTKKPPKPFIEVEVTNISDDNVAILPLRPWGGKGWRLEVSTDKAWYFYSHPPGPAVPLTPESFIVLKGNCSKRFRIPLHGMFGRSKINDSEVTPIESLQGAIKVKTEYSFGKELIMSLRDDFISTSLIIKSASSVNPEYKKVKLSDNEENNPETSGKKRISWKEFLENNEVNIHATCKAKLTL